MVFGSLVHVSKELISLSSEGHWAEGAGKICPLWRCADFALMWNVWPEENSTLFEGKEEDVELLWDRIYF